jgi:type II secretory pathway component PulJ
MRRFAGFTLLEMLVVIGVTALLVATAVQAHLGIRRAQERAALGMERSRAAEVFLDRIERELSGTLLVVRGPSVRRRAHPYLFVGADRLEAGADADALRFVTRTPARATPLADAVGVRMITYQPRASEESGLELLREEKSLPDFMDKYPVVEEGGVALDRIANFDITYLDGRSAEWLEEWDSTHIARLDRLPVAVEVAVVLEEEGGEQGEPPVTGPEHLRTIPLPVRPVDLEALRDQGAAEETRDPNSPGESEGEETENAADPNQGSVSTRCVEVARCADLAGSAEPGFAATLEGVGRVCDPDEVGQLREMVEALGGRWTCP